MARSSRVTCADLRALLRLAGELHELPDTRETRGLHALRRLGELCRAPVVSAQEVCDFVPHSRSHPTLWAMGIIDEPGRRIFERWCRETQCASPVIDRLAERPHRVCLRTELSPDREYYRTDEYNEAYRVAGLYDGVLGSYLTPRRGHAIGIGLHRRPGEPRFGPRERAILQIFQDEFGWFFRSIATAPAPPRFRLPPHLLRTLERLLAGDSE